MANFIGDLHRLTEDQRIMLIGTRAMTGQVVGFIVEDNEKADRYMRKLIDRFPLLHEKERGPFAGGTVFVQCTRRPETLS
jgi:hypothetical protein